MCSSAGAGSGPALGPAGGGGCDADAGVGAEDAVVSTALVAVETGSESTPQGAACGRVGPGCRTQGATVPAAPSRPGGELQGELQAQRGGRPEKDLGAEAGLAAEAQASQLRILEEDSGAEHCDQYLCRSVPSSRETDFLSLASSDEQNVQQDLLIGQTEGTFHPGPSDESSGLHDSCWGDESLKTPPCPYYL